MRFQDPVVSADTLNKMSDEEYDTRPYESSGDRVNTVIGKTVLAAVLLVVFVTPSIMAHQSAVGAVADVAWALLLFAMYRVVFPRNDRAT
jgi:Na+/H+ antiporter NhaD/arsenite permease-like protein